jgi:hypothetical protein
MVEVAKTARHHHCYQLPLTELKPLKKLSGPALKPIHKNKNNWALKELVMKIITLNKAY